MQTGAEESDNDFFKRYQQFCIRREEDGAYCVKSLGNMNIHPFHPAMQFVRTRPVP